MNQRAGRRPAEMTVTYRRPEPDTLVLERPRRFHFPVPVDSTWDGPTEEIRLPARRPSLHRLWRNVAYGAVVVAVAAGLAAGGVWLDYAHRTGASPVVVCPIDRR